LTAGGPKRHTCNMSDAGSVEVASDDDFVTSIIDELKKGGGLNDPRVIDRHQARIASELAKLDEATAAGHRGADPSGRDRLNGELRDLEKAAKISLAAHARTEARRSIERVRLRRTYKLPAEIEVEIKSAGKLVKRQIALPKLTLSDFRKAAKALRKVAFTEAQQTAVRQLEAVWQEPPERAGALKHYCAAEAYFLMQCFSVVAPTGYEGGSFLTIACLIHDAVTGRTISAIGMKRSCDLVLGNRRRYAPTRSKRT
jgi:hypothetical protein